MAQFKPMVKMTTNEPSVMLKLKKGGKVAKADAAESKFKKMAGGGAMSMLGMTPAFVGRPAVNAPVKSPGKPSMSARKKAMAAKKPAKKPRMPKEMSMMPPMMPPMKKGGSADKSQDKAMVKKAFKQHDMQEHKGGKGTKLSLKKGGQTYADGGSVSHSPMSTPANAKPPTANRGVGEYVQTAMRTAKNNPKGYAYGGSVKTVVMSTDKKRGNNGFATGGVAMSNAGGYKKGGKPKKMAMGGIGQRPLTAEELNRKDPNPGAIRTNPLMEKVKLQIAGLNDPDRGGGNRPRPRLPLINTDPDGGNRPKPRTTKPLLINDDNDPDRRGGNRPRPQTIDLSSMHNDPDRRGGNKPRTPLPQAIDMPKPNMPNRTPRPQAIDMPRPNMPMKKGGKAMMMGGYATGGVPMSNAGGYKKGGKTSKKAYATGGTVNTGKPVAMQEGNKSVPAPKRQQNFSGTYKDGGEVAKMAMGGRMGQKPAQTIRTAPIGSSQATRDFFASKGKRPSYKDGGKVPKMLGGGILTRAVAAGKNPARAPTGGGVIARATQAMQNMPKQSASTGNGIIARAMQTMGPSNRTMSPKVIAETQMLLERQAADRKRRGLKDGGGVENKSLVKINKAQNAPAVKASKADTNLKYPETMNSPQKTPKLKC